MLAWARQRRLAASCCSAGTALQPSCLFWSASLTSLPATLLATLPAPAPQLYGADERTTGVVPVSYAGGRSTQAAVGWAPGQVTPSQMILVRAVATLALQGGQRSSADVHAVA